MRLPTVGNKPPLHYIISCPRSSPFTASLTVRVISIFKPSTRHHSPSRVPLKTTPTSSLLFLAVFSSAIPAVSSSAGTKMAGHDKNDDGFDGNMPDLGDAIDLLTFSQILDMDDSEEDREFSRSIVYGFFEQAEETFEKMDEALKARDLEELYRLGHYLKGSSATVGLTKVKDSCEKIQRYGKKENVDGTPEPDVELCLSRIKSTLITVKSEYIEAEKTLKKFFDSA